MELSNSIFEGKGTRIRQSSVTLLTTLNCFKIKDAISYSAKTWALTRKSDERQMDNLMTVVGILKICEF